MDFKASYKRTDFMRYLQDDFLPDDFSPADELLAIKPSGKIKSARLIGSSKALRIKVIELSHDSVSDPRVSLSRESFRLMRDYNFENALAVFRSEKNDNWRLSLITTDLEYDDKTKKVKKAFSNPRRASFFLGPGAKTKTAQFMLQSQGRVGDKADLRKRFSLEVVNKEFYNRIASLFSKLAGGKRLEGNAEVDYAGLIKLPGTADRKLKQEFAVRLIGRTVFCWFLREKGLIGLEQLSSAAARMAQGFYHRGLEHLFFQVLNTPQAERRATFKTAAYTAVPFLNGGLFSPHVHDYYDYDSATEISTNLNTLTIPDEWLIEFIEVLESYNFTVDENTSVDIDLSIDPEMLGRIFENLLAEINPETGDTARRQTGSFYTPRSIVDYMVTESLKSYLLSALWPEARGKAKEEAESRLLELFSYETEELRFEPADKGRIIDALHAMKCLDPACGSGAFPMGLLQKTLLALERLDPEGERWLQKQLEGIPDPTFRTQAEESLKAKNYDYIHKLGIVQNCIYGIDIQPIAVEISKLRAFLSLIVEEEVDETKPNRGIEALPNLEFKFVCADSLVGLPKAEHLSYGFDYNEKTIKELELERSRYLSASGQNKEKIKEKYAELQRVLFSMADWADKKTSKSFALSTWDPFGDEASSWFDPFWMYGLKEEKSGFFDIVIANPPYISLQKHDSKNTYKTQGFSSFAARGDIYCLFYERGFSLLKEGGHLCYITSNKWMRAAYGEALRTWFGTHARIDTLIDFGDAQLFENATTYTDILIGARKVAGQGDRLPVVADLSKKVSVDADLYSLLRAAPAAIADFSPESYLILSKAELELKRKIEQLGTPLEEWEIDISYGLKTGFNKAFIIDGATKDALIAEDPASSELIKPLLRGRDIKRYAYEFADQWIILAKFGSHKYLKKDFPAIYRHLFQFRGQLEARGQCSYSRASRVEAGAFPGQHHWLELDNNPQDEYLKSYQADKLIWAEIVLDSAFVFDNKENYVEATAFFMTGKNLKFVIGCLNSKLLTKAFRHFFSGGDLRGKTFRYKKEFLQRLPIIRSDSPSARRSTTRKNPEGEASGSIAKAIETSAVKIQKLKDKGEDSGAWEAYVDKLVYDLYDLTEEEIAFVERSVANA